MSAYRIGERIKIQIVGTRQVWFFVCSSWRPDAVIVAAHICLSDAKREARGLGGYVRTGYYEGNYETGKVVIL